MSFWYSSRHYNSSRMHSTEHEAFGNWLRKPEWWKSCWCCSPAIIPKPYFQSACLFSVIPPSVRFIWLGSCSVRSTFQEERGQKHRHVSKKTDKLLWCHLCGKWVSRSLRLVFLIGFACPEQHMAALAHPWSIIQWVFPFPEHGAMNLDFEV